MDNTLSLDYQQTDFGREFAEEVERLDGRIDDETEARSDADDNLQNQIDTIKASSDVVDIVGTYAELEQYDTTKLNDNDIVKVLEDETHDGDITYYRWSTSTEAFSFVGSLSAYYSKGETDTLLSGKQDTLTAGTNVQISAGNVISATDTTYSAFTGATSSAAGAEGLVPAPTAGDNMKYLSGDGTWKTINASSVTVFYYNYGYQTTTTLYSDYGMTTAVRGVDIEAAFKQSKVVVYYKNRSNGDMYVEVTTIKYSRWVPGSLYVVVAMVSDTYTPSIDGFFYDDKYTTTCSRGTTPLQAPLIAGPNISITDGPDGPIISATDTTYSAFTGATSSVAGAAGLVPAPVAGDGTKYLSGDGTWKTINTGSETVFYNNYDYGSTDGTLYSDSAMTTAVKGEDVEAAFNQGRVIVCYKNESDGDRYVEVVGLGYHRWVPNYLDVEMALDSYDLVCFRYWDKTTTTCSREKAPLQWPLTAGANISITAGPFGDTISATDTTYSAFTGATSSVAGSAGLVPAPQATDVDKFLKSDGTWATVSGGGGGGTTNYNSLSNKPKINNVTLEGNKSLSELGVQPAGDYALESEIPDVSNLANKISVVQTSASTIEINPNTFYKFGEVASLNITLASITDNTIYNEYMFEFVSGTTATTLTLPSSIKWLETPTIDANKIYQCSIVDNVGLLVGVANV